MIRDEEGDPAGPMPFARDVSERTPTEEALRESEERLRDLFEHAPVGIFHSVPEGRFLTANPALADMLGYSSPQELISDTADMTTQIYADPEARPRIMDVLMATDGWMHLDEVTWRRKDGSLIAVDMTGRKVLDERGHLAYLEGFIRDVTARKRAEEEIRRLNAELEERVLARTAQLEAANRELEAFVYSASHDLRAPLRAIDGFSQMVAEDADERLDGKEKANLQRVRAAAQRMGVLIDHLLALSRAGRGDLRFEHVDVTAAAASVLDDLRSAQPDRAVEVVVQPGLVAYAEATLLNLILSNLLENAWKFTSRHETARIEVGVVPRDGEAVFFVKDDGAGFDERTAQHLFGAFQRLHTADQFPGDGIGLATVQRLVAKHGGRVWAEAEIDKGATFFFTLPEPPVAG